MTKSEFIEQILQTAENAEDRETARDGIDAMLATLVPRDRERFARWGYPKDQTTAGNCWD